MPDLKLSKNGVTIRFGGTDTPVPNGVVRTTPVITVAVSPLNLSAQVAVVLRVRTNETTIPLKAVVRAGEEEFHKGEFPDVAAGETVEYFFSLKPVKVGQFEPFETGSLAGGLLRYQYQPVTVSPGPVTINPPIISPPRIPVSGPVGGVIPPVTVPPVVIAPLTPDLSTSPADTTKSMSELKGNIDLEFGIPAANVSLAFYTKTLGGKDVKFASGSTNNLGEFNISFDGTSKPASVEVRALVGGKEIPLTQPGYNVDVKKPLNLVAPGSVVPLEKEYARISKDLTAQLGTTKLASIRETGDQKDLTLLTKATGWDSRVIAMSAWAARLAADPQIGLPEKVLYGLVRAGLPSEKSKLAAVTSATIPLALTKARDSGIVDLSDAEIADATTKFKAFAVNAKLGSAIPGLTATYNDLLKASALPDPSQKKFSAVFAEHTGSADELWGKAKTAGLNDGEVNKLKYQGKLAFLTGNNATLITKLQQEVKDVQGLVAKGLYNPAVWKERIKTAAGNDPVKIKNLIPEGFVGADDNERLDAYAKDMAMKVRVGFPTEVITHMVESDTADVYKLKTARIPASKLLKNISPLGFKLGETPVDKFLKERENDNVFVGLDKPSQELARKSVKRLTTAYQLSPNNEAMEVLLKYDLTSAYDILQVRLEEFVQLYGASFASVEECKLVYRKAQQIESVTFNLFAAARKMETEPVLFALSPSGTSIQNSKDALVKQFPTLQSLFGSMDFCECEHCRSVLSPAAYFVDIMLQFVDVETGTWNNFLTQWRNTHGGTDYTVKYQHPYDALTSKRVDLVHLKLTCENTNMVLPYIDIVNEIMEYFVANNATLGMDAARDTGTATSAELLAEPHFVVTGAYDRLKTAKYPIGLPFQLWLERVRIFCDYFEVPLWKLLEALCTSDELYVAASKFDRSSIFAEQLGISPAEYAILTDPAALTTWFELYGYGTAAEATTVSTNPTTLDRVDLNSAKALSRRLCITYKETRDVILTHFVNPRLSDFAILTKLGMTLADILNYRTNKPLYDANVALIGATRSQLSAANQAKYDLITPAQWDILNETHAFKLKLVAAGTAAGFNSATWLDATIASNVFDSILVLADPNSGCDFDQTTLRYASGRSVDAIALLRINLFVRLWRKLKWTINEVDLAISAFTPSSLPFEAASVPQSPLKSPLVCLAHLKTLDDNLKIGKQKLISLWRNLPTRGAGSLYSKMFLTKPVLSSDPVFDHPLGNYLQFQDGAVYKDFVYDATKAEDPRTGNVSLKSHLLVVQGAMGLTSDEVSNILSAEGKSLATCELSMSTISLLHRYAVLSKALKLSVANIISVKQLSGLQPFPAISAAPIATIAQDVLFNQTMRFVEFIRSIRESGLKIEDLDYLVRHLYNDAYKGAVNESSFIELLLTIRNGIQAILNEHGIPQRPGNMPSELLSQKLSLILQKEVVDQFMAMLSGSMEFTSSPVPATVAFDPRKFSGEPTFTAFNFDTVKKEQRLTFKGVLTQQRKADLLAKYPLGATPHVESPVLKSLLDNVQKQARDFFDAHFLRKPIVKPESGFLGDADYALLFDPVLAAGETLAQRLQKQSERLATTFFPYLQGKLIHRLIVESLAAYTGVDVSMVETLINDPAFIQPDSTLPIPPTAIPPLAAIDGLRFMNQQGITASFYTSVDATGSPSSQTQVPILNNQATIPAGTKSAMFEGYFQVPSSGPYRFVVTIDKKDCECELRFGHLADPVFLKRKASADNFKMGDGPSEYLEFQPGVLYRFTLIARMLGNGNVQMTVQGETLPVSGLERLNVIPGAIVAKARGVVVRLQKILKIMSGLSISISELQYIAGHKADFDQFDLVKLPASAGSITAAEVNNLFRQLLRLIDYNRVKTDTGFIGTEMIGMLNSGDAKVVYDAFARVFNIDKAVVEATAIAIFNPPSFRNEINFRRLATALQIVKTFGVPLSAILEWSGIRANETTPGAHAKIADNMKEAIKARFNAASWQQIAQPIFDKIRQLQRDALVTYIMFNRGFDRREQLYEYFLIDPGMEPVVQTSRIRLAISSVQLFIQRCLLNLENVHPSAIINAPSWEWMKRYRVWEANRKIFLYPENWLEPEFRDNKSHLFKELESTLFKNDVTRDVVEDAFLTYLTKLEELSRLDMVALHVEDNPDAALTKVHVIGRTYTQPYKYFYRVFMHQQWEPWQPVTAEIEGNHLVPVTWRDRLYLFWITFLEKPDPYPNSTFNDSATMSSTPMSTALSNLRSSNSRKLVEASLHWSEFMNGEWTTRESTGQDIPASKTLDASFDPKSVLVSVSKEYDGGEERGVRIHLNEPFSRTFYLAGRNSKPIIGNYASPPPNPYSAKSVVFPTRYRGNEQLRANPGEGLEVEIIKSVPNFEILPCNNELATITGTVAALIKPFFLQDNKNTFFVVPDVTETKITEWQDWATFHPAVINEWELPKYWEELPLIPHHPPWIDKFPIDEIDEISILKNDSKNDWLVNKSTGLIFDSQVIGKVGSSNILIRDAADFDESNDVGVNLSKINVSGGSRLAEGKLVEVKPELFRRAGIEIGPNVRIISGGGLNPTLASLNKEIVKATLN